MPSSETKPHLLKNLFIILLALFLSLVALEVAFRFLLPRLSSSSSDPQSDRPHTYFVSESSRSPRDYRYEEVKPPGSYRIAVYGDSFTFGTGILFDDSFPKRLERILNLNKDQPRIEVMNMGVPGYSTRAEVTYAQETLPKYNPDLVILEITLNDPEIVPYKLPGGTMRDRMGRVVMEGGIFDYWKSLGYLVARLKNSDSQSEYKKYFQNLFTNQDTLQSFRSALRDFAELCKSKNIKLVAVVFPLVTFPLDDSYPFFEAHKTTAGILKELDVPSLDLFESFRGLSPTRLQTEPGADPHPNEIAHRIAAEQIYSWLSKQQLFPTEAAVHITIPERKNQFRILDKK